MQVMRNRFLSALSATALASIATTSHANEKCSPAKQLVKVAQSFYGDKPDLVDVIDPKLNVGMKGINGHPDPTHMLYRFEAVEKRLPIIEGNVVGLEAAAGWSKDGELCSVYKDGPLPETEESTVSLSVGFEFPFRRGDGAFSVKEIAEGAKDGSKIIKSLAPSGFGFAAPGLKTLVISPESNENAVPTLIFSRGEKPVDVSISNANRMQYIRLKDIKSAKADRLEVKGPYKAFAFFKIDPDEMAKNEAKRLAELEDPKN